MHPPFTAWRRGRRGCGHGFAMREHCGPGDDAFEGGGGFGVRRPLRFLANHLDLDDAQIAVLARILDELKTERAQGEVDRRRTVSALADALAADSFDAAKATEAAQLRATSAQRLGAAVVQALQQIHQALKPEQRARLAYLIRAGRLAI
jgi:Spy/CpxP family protein refolding chaperone